MKNITCTNCKYKGKPAVRTSPVLMVLLAVIFFPLFFPFSILFLYFGLRRDRCPKCGNEYCIIE